MTNKKDSYDYVATKFIPVVKSRAAMVLFNQYGLTQQSISKMLGVSQAEVSKYLSGKGAKAGDIEINNKDIEAFAQSIVIKDEYNAQKIVCSICPKGASKSCSIMIK
ncbi:MAG: helix-turn-helix domain-containing protein [Methanothrix sp.]